MVLTRWDPFFEIRRARHLANRRFAGYNADERRDWSIPLDIVRDGDTVTVKASLPGVQPDDIDVTIEGGVLTIKADTKTKTVRMAVTSSGSAGRGLSTARCGCRRTWTPTRLSPVTRTAA